MRGLLVEALAIGVDEDLFEYVPKDAAQRLRVLSIRPFATPMYANDLTVAAIQAASVCGIWPMVSRNEKISEAAMIIRISVLLSTGTIFV